MPLASRVTSIVLREPLTWLALGLVVGLETAFFGWFRPSLLASAAALGLGLVSLLAWSLLFVRSPRFQARLHGISDLGPATGDKLEALLGDFEEMAYEQGATQAKMLNEKFENLSDVLNRRLSDGELTYARYLGMAEQVYLSGLDNLHEVAVALRSIRTIDPDRIRTRLAELEAAGSASAERRKESAALQERKELHTAQQQRVDQLIAQNEAAMTVLDKTATALAETKTGKGQASIDADTAIAGLERLAKQAGAYAATD